MIKRLAPIALAAGVLAAPAFAQRPLPPEIQEMVDKVHLGVDDNRLAALETLTEVLDRRGPDILHKPSGFLRQHWAESLSGCFPGLVTIFDDPRVANDSGCGMLAQGVNISVFIFKRPSDLGPALREEADAARHDCPPAARQDASVLPAVEAGALGVETETPFAADAWTDTSGATQVVYLARFGEWCTRVRITMDPAETATGVAQARRQFALAASTIKR